MNEPSLDHQVTALICEDEPLAVRALREYLQDVPWVRVMGEARNGKEALRLIQKLEPDLIFLDVEMPGLSGLEVLESLTHEPAIVFTTAHEEYALPAFEFGAVDYLLKPFGRKRLIRALDRIRVKLLGEGAVGGEGKRRRGSSVARLFAHHRKRMVPIATGEIIRVEAESGGSALVTGSGTFLLDRTLSELEARLDPEEFVRLHRGHLVNLAHLKGVRRYDDRRLLVEMEDGSTVVTSRAGAKALRAIMD